MSLLAALVVLLVPGCGNAPPAGPQPALRLTNLGTYVHGAYDEGGAEISAYDPATRRLFVVNGNPADPSVDILDLSDPTTPRLVGSILVGALYGGAANSVAAKNGVIALAIEDGSNRQAPGKVVFVDAAGVSLGGVRVGALPDMVTFTPDGSALLVANEGEPSEDYTSDPEGSVSWIDLSGGIPAATVTTIGFADFNAGGPRHGELPAGVRVYGPGSSVAQDLEPEYIAIAPDGRKAWVSLQENNALAILDLATRRVEAIVALGFKDHSLPGNGLDPSDRDGVNAIANWPVRGMFQPDGIAAFDAAGRTYVVMANEGDVRSYAALDEQSRVADLGLDPAAFPGAVALQTDGAIGRLVVTNRLGDSDGDGDFDTLYVPGARSISIRDTAGALVWDSGDLLERTHSAEDSAHFNASATSNARDERSDDRGAEPEGLALATVEGRTYAFVGLERSGGVVILDITIPAAPAFVTHVDARDFTREPGPGSGGDLAPEGILFIPEADSPTGQALVVVSNEVSGTTTVYGLDRRPGSAP